MCRTVRLAVKGWFGERKRGAPAVRLARCAARRRWAASAAIAGRSPSLLSIIGRFVTGSKREVRESLLILAQVDLTCEIRPDMIEHRVKLLDYDLPS